ncbi:tRNA (guanine10-N2)-methyltransferase [Marchantia polymorpha subsp. ruderalis]|uniref:tRNA (guanine(10)-N(2))-methyltransferase n=4 Tax=Marchantia polymorpha TaxID=3197 RepID=A0AAF6AY97_MARPO|nr:hypothetical protein MARPO_0006s0193 [Marchantia polymorpha]BBN04731.1 hypothetical protein Mp_3g07200 [Marchantia polymorpha subsp. ruderalis]|eukprot:PTQ48175.1 hypothetical protein MARPO_0006s0193 [Marchantia polymorpha]
MWFLCYFLHRLLDYRKPEIESLAKLFLGENAELKWKQSPHHHEDSPFYFIDLPSEDVARQIASRSVLLKGFFEVWGEGRTYDELKASIESLSDEKKAPFLTEDSTFKIVVDAFGKVLSLDEQNERIHALSYIPFMGAVNLKNPQHKFWIIETEGNDFNNGLPPADNRSIIFGREIGLSNRKVVVKYELSRRSYLGPTAMDAEVALLMANQALAKPGKLVYDPFVGTGSILVAAAHCGAMTMGADIDIRVIRDGKGPDRNVWSNFKQYELPSPVGLIRADNNVPPWRPNLFEVYDAIICDPPYGVRAGGRKSGGRKMLQGIRDPYTIQENMRKDHIPSTAPYTLAECLHDLLDMAARLLVIGGRLVFFYPAPRDECGDDFLPKHPCFTLIANSEQILSSRYSRCLLTMEKTSKYTEIIAATARRVHQEFKDNHSEMLQESRENGSLHHIVFAPSNEAHRLEGSESRPRYRGKYV